MEVESQDHPPSVQPLFFAHYCVPGKPPAQPGICAYSPSAPRMTSSLLWPSAQFPGCWGRGRGCFILGLPGVPSPTLPQNRWGVSLLSAVEVTMTQTQWA